MRIGIIGAGMIGGTLARLWATDGHQVMVSSRHPDALRSSVGPIVQIGSVLDAARFGDAVLLAIPFGASADLPPDVVRALSGKIVLDAGNPFEQRDGKAATDVAGSGQGSGMWTAAHLPGARVVKAFNTVHFKTLASEAHRAGDRVGIPLASDDDEALEVAVGLVEDAGFEPVIVGPLEHARDFDPGTPTWNTGRTGPELRRHFQDPER
jgi:predicted dinucleotide-binding enzyme